MPEPLLYERLDAASSMDFLKKEIPDCAAPFYNNDDENQFREGLDSVLK